MFTRRSILRGAAITLGAPMINVGRCTLFARSPGEYSVRAVDLVRGSTVIDMLGLLTLNYRKVSAWGANPEQFRETEYLRLRNSGINTFHPAVGFIEGDIHAQTLRDVVGWNSFIKAHGERFQRIENADDFKKAKAAGKIGILIGQQKLGSFPRCRGRRPLPQARPAGLAANLSGHQHRRRIFRRARYRAEQLRRSDCGANECDWDGGGCIALRRPHDDECNRGVASTCVDNALQLPGAGSGEFAMQNG